MELAEHLFEKMSEQNKIYCLNEVLRLSLQITSGYGLGEPYYLVLDNDVLNALQKPDMYSVRYVALILLFRTIVKQGGDFRILVNTAIFYEFSGEKAFQSEDDYDAAWSIFRKAVNPTGLKIYSIGFETFRQAKAQLKSIKHDIAAINGALEKIKKINWKVNLKKGNAIVFPHVVACEMCPQIKTKYFSERRAKTFLENVIQSKIVHHKGNDPDALRIMRNNEVIRESKLMEIEKGRLKGVGDLSLLSLCDIGSQFHGEAPFTAIGLTFDKRLETVLASHSSLAIQSQQLIAGKDDEESVKNTVLDFVEKSRTLYEINNKAENFHAGLIYILGNVEWVKNVLQLLQSEKEAHNPEKEDAQLAAADGQAAAP